MTFHDPHLNSMTFQAWKMKFENPMTFQVFHDLYEPCLNLTLNELKKLTLLYTLYLIPYPNPKPKNMPQGLLCNLVPIIMKQLILQWNTSPCEN